VRELEGKLAQTPSVPSTPARSQTAGKFPWSLLGVGVIGAGVVLALVLTRRRTPIESYAQPREVVPPPASLPPMSPGSPATTVGQPPTAAAAGFPPSAGTGIGSSIAGGLAGGLAAGAGIVAGEEIARHLLGSGEHEVSAAPPASEPAQEPQNAELGGPDFGVSDASSWDDDDQASGGDDWT
jgi:hypothetical protein